MPELQRARLQRRLLVHHAPLVAVSISVVSTLYFSRSYTDVLSRASFATAYPALVLLAATLLIGPWNVLRKQRNPVSSDLRRDLGIWAGILGIAHSAIGQNVHLRGRPWLYYVYEHRLFIPRHDLFGFSNYTGLLSILIVIALLATSNDYALRALGTPGWKQLQRWNYAAFALAAAHTIAYQWKETLGRGFVLLVFLLIAVTLALQAAGLRKRSLARIDART